MNSQLKRKRDAGLPRIMFSAADKTFARIFKEDSLRELKDLVREKLALPPSQELQFSYAQEDRHLDLEDEGDFDAFYCFAHAVPPGKMVHVNVRVQGTVPISPVPPMRESDKPAEKRQKSGPSPTTAAAPDASPSAEAAAKETVSPTGAAAPGIPLQTVPPAEPIHDVSVPREESPPTPSTPTPKVVAVAAKAAAKPKKPTGTKDIDTTPTRPKKTPAEVVTSQSGASSATGSPPPMPKSPTAEQTTTTKAPVEPQPIGDKNDAEPVTTKEKEASVPKPTESEKTPVVKKPAAKKVAHTEVSGEEDNALADKPPKGKKTAKTTEKKGVAQQRPSAEKTKAGDAAATEKEKKRKRTTAKDVEEEPTGLTPAKRKKKKESAQTDTEAIVKNVVGVILAKAAASSASDITPEPSNLEEDTSEAQDDVNVKVKPTAKKTSQSKAPVEPKTPAKPKAEKPKSKAQATKAPALTSVKSSASTETCPMCKESPGHPSEDCPALRTIKTIQKRMTELKKEKGDNSKLISDLQQIIESKRRPRGSTPKVAPEQSAAQTRLKATRPGRVSEVTVQHEDEGSSNDSDSEDDASKSKKTPPVEVPVKTRGSLITNKKLDDVISRMVAEESDSDERLELEEEEDVARSKKAKRRQTSVSSEEGSGPEASDHSPPVTAPPTVRSVVNGATKANGPGSTSRTSDERDSASVAKLLSSSSRGSSFQRNATPGRPVTPSNPPSIHAWQALQGSTVSQPGPSEPRGQTDEEDELASSPKSHNDLFLPSETQLQFPYSQATKFSVLSPYKEDEDEVPSSESEKEDDEDVPRIATQPVVSPFPRLTDIQSQRPFSQSPQTYITPRPKVVRHSTGFGELYGKEHQESESDSDTESESEPEKISHIPITRMVGRKKRK